MIIEWKKDMEIDWCNPFIRYSKISIVLWSVLALGTSLTVEGEWVLEREVWLFGDGFVVGCLLSGRKILD
jgi:hypothetical protein